MNAAMQWISANRLTTVISALVLLNLLLFLVSFFYRRRKNAGTEKLVKAPIPSLNPSTDIDSKVVAEPASPGVSIGLSKEPLNGFAASGRATDRHSTPASASLVNSSQISVTPDRSGRNKPAPEPAMARSGFKVQPNHAGAPIRRALSSSEREHESNKEDEEREVFEL